MDKPALLIIFAASVLLLIVGPTGCAAPPSKLDPALAEQMRSGAGGEIPVIVIFKGPDASDLQGLEVKYRYRLIEGAAGRAAPAEIERLAMSESVLGVYLDGPVNVEMPAENTSNRSILCPATDIGAEKLWQKGIDGQGITVAVIDSGIDRNHPDLAGKVIGEKNFVDDEASSDDLLGHGTMVAGIVAGSGASSGGKYRGVAPGASLLNVKVIDKSGNGKISDIIAGIEWALYNGADVLSLSLGGMNLGETNPPITMAADNAADAGAVVCVAAGNRNNTKLEGLAQSAGSGSVSSEDRRIGVSQQSQDKDVLLLLVPILLALPPGLIDSPGDGVRVITVGSSDCEGRIASFSGSGPTRDGRTKPDVVGPGVDVISTVPMALEGPKYVDIYYARESGTSLSTPAVAGLAALLLQAQPELTPAGVKAALAKGAERLNNSLGEEYEQYYQGAGLINAERSYQQLDQDLCAAMPDRWEAGRWAYLPAGKGLYVGLDAGADRPQKKLYALAPGDEDLDTKFVFFTDKERTDLEISASGDVADWIALQPLPKSVPANGQKSFGASLTVPTDASSGSYSGTINIKDRGRTILAIPVDVLVAEHLEVTRGRGSSQGTLDDSQWHYYYLDVPLGSSELVSRLSAKSGWSSLDLFLLAPTSEYYASEDKRATQEISIQSPPSGRWLLAVHSENLTAPVNYSLEVERSLIESNPRRWNVEKLSPGTTVSALFNIENQGLPLENLSYGGVIENITAVDLSGSVGHKEIWESTLNVTNHTSRLSARLRSQDRNNQSQLLFLFEDPGGEPSDADLGTGDLGPLEVSWPRPGLWKIRVYGYQVPEDGQAFEVRLMRYREESWTWISTSGPSSIDSESNGTAEAVLSIPENTSAQRVAGYLEVSWDNRSFQIPVAVTVAGTSLEGLRSVEAEDRNGDGYYELLTLQIGIDAAVFDSYRVEAVLADCAGNRIERLGGIWSSEKDGDIRISVNGSRIWKDGRCGPLRLENLILRDSRGDLIDRFNGSIEIDRDPKSFQPPPAFFAGSFQNRSGEGKISVGIDITIIDPGRYRIEGSVVDDRGVEMGRDSVTRTLKSGNTTLYLEFNPTKFKMLRKSSRLHLVDLSLSREGTELDRLENAWSSEVMDPEGFGSIAGSASSVPDSTNASRSGSLKIENGRAVIS